MLIKCLSKTTIVLLCVFLCSCATTYKPSYYNAQSRVFNNYEKNYSAKIPDNYVFLEPTEDLDSMSKEFLSGLGENGDALMSYKKYSILFTFFTKKETISDGLKKRLDKSFNEKNSISDLMSSLAKQNIIKEAIKTEFDSKFKKSEFKPSSIRISSQGEYLMVSIIIETQLLDIYANAAITYFKPDQNVHEYYSFNAISFNFQTSTIVAYEELVKFIEGVELGNLMDKERYANNSPTK